MKRIVFLTICFILLIVIANLSKSIYELYHKKDVLVSTQEKLTNVASENQKLRQQLTQVQSPGFVEEEARNKLFLAKPGESTVILPSPTPEIQAKISTTLPNWQQWWQVFFD
ncbi:MAG TPA: septum formation initiator family protein [Patescibacteria group bacterium]